MFSTCTASAFTYWVISPALYLQSSKAPTAPSLVGGAFQTQTCPSLGHLCLPHAQGTSASVVAVTIL